MKTFLRATVLTLITAGILSAATMPKNVQTTGPKLSPIPMCDPGNCNPFPH